VRSRPHDIDLRHRQQAREPHVGHPLPRVRHQTVPAHDVEHRPGQRHRHVPSPEALGLVTGRKKARMRVGIQGISPLGTECFGSQNFSGSVVIIIALHGK